MQASSTSSSKSGSPSHSRPVPRRLGISATQRSRRWMLSLTVTYAWACAGSEIEENLENSRLGSSVAKDLDSDLCGQSGEYLQYNRELRARRRDEISTTFGRRVNIVK